MRIKDLCKEAHKTSRLKGFWGAYGKDLATHKAYYVHNRNLSEMLMLIVTELGEACEALRQDKRQDISEGEQITIDLSSFKEKRKKIKDFYWQKDTFEDELADVFIRLGDLCEALDIDIEWQIRKKLEYNKTRSVRHGKKF